MTPIIDIFFPANGICITIINLFQVSILFHNDEIDIQLSLYKLGIKLALIKSEDSLCQEMQEVKSQ